MMREARPRRTCCPINMTRPIVQRAAHKLTCALRLVLVRRIFRGLNNARLLRATQGQSRIRPWRTSHA